MDHSTKTLGISVVIPAHNEHQNIARTLESLLHQTLPPDEIIIVDNASTDDTAAIISGYQSKFNDHHIRLVLVNQPIIGVARTRNAGFSLAKNKIIASTDADATVAPDWVSSINSHFSKHNSDGVSGNIIFFDAPWLMKFLSAHGWYQFLNWVSLHFLGFRPLHTANCAVKKESFKLVGGFNETINSTNDLDDFEFSSRLVEVGIIRFDPALVAQMSFRRYNSLSKLKNNLIPRLKSWGKISRDYRRRQRKKSTATS